MAIASSSGAYNQITIGWTTQAGLSSVLLGEVEVDDLDVDITTCDKIAAYVSSDEEEEDRGCLLYLPIAPEVEEPEDSQLNLVSWG